MDLKRIEILLQAVDHGNLTLTAEAAGYTQSGVSHIIKHLEDSFGFPLLHRFHTGVAPTEDAKRLLPTMREFVDCYRRLEQQAAAIKGLETGVVRVGTLASVSAQWMPRIIQGFQWEHPNIDVRLFSGGGGDVEKWLEHNRVDFAISTRQGGEAFEWSPLAEDSYFAVLPSGHPLAGLTEFPIQAFQGQRVILVPESVHRDTYNLLRKHGVKPDFYHSAADDLTQICMVESGLGLTIFPGLVLRAYLHRRIQVIPLAPASTRTLGILARSLKKAAPAVSTFIAYTQGQIAAMLREQESC